MSQLLDDSPGGCAGARASRGAKEAVPRKAVDGQSLRQDARSAIICNVDPLSDEDVMRLLPILSTRARASQGTLDGFRPPHVGIVEQVGSARHHFVVGRRGVGKSMLLMTVARRRREAGQPAVYLDIEKLRDNPYPDVLIRLLIALAQALEESLRPRNGKGFKVWRQRRKAWRELANLREHLEVLLLDPQEFMHRIEESHNKKRSRSSKAAAKAAVPIPHIPVSVAAGAAVEGSNASEATEQREAAFGRTKLDGLRAEAVEIASAFEHAVEAAGDAGVIVVLDDFYFIPREHQPDVLSYLQQVVKNLNIWLKVGAVEHRLNEFEDGDPPRGLQLNQDAGRIQMDNTLIDFEHTKRFLEDILGDICTEAGVDVNQLVTLKARTRLVLASGGVPRDYVNLLEASLSKSTRRIGSANRPKNKITAEDVSEAAPDFLKQRQDDLRVDAQPGDVDRIRVRLNDVLNFCLNLRKVNVFSVETRMLREEQWGQDIAALADLRFFHRVGNMTVKSGDPAFVGTSYQAFALDLSSYARTRVRTREIEFWTTDGFQDVRAVSYVYTPEATTELAPASTPRRSTATSIAPEHGEQLDLLEALERAEADALAGEIAEVAEPDEPEE